MHKRSASMDRNYGSSSNHNHRQYYNQSSPTTQERTFDWVESQAEVKYSPPPSPPSLSGFSTVRAHNHQPPPSLLPQESGSNRTTASSEQSMQSGGAALGRRESKRRGGPPPSPLHINPVPSASSRGPPPASVLMRVGSQREGRELRHKPRLQLPFPQSPPGSGYPMALQVAPPRSPEIQEGSRSGIKVSKPVLTRKRRPSLIEQIKSLAVKDKDKGDESTKKR